MSKLRYLLVGVDRSCVAWGDYDNDGDLDILLTGNINTGYARVSKIYRNEGNNVFTEQTSISITGVRIAQSLGVIMIMMEIWIFFNRYSQGKENIFKNLSQ